MTQKTKEPVRVADDRPLLLRYVLTRGSDYEELDLSPSELQEIDADLAELEAGKNGRPKTNKWVLLH